MLNTKVITLEIPCSAQFVSVSRRTLEGVTSGLPLAQDQLDDLKLAVGEACTNAVKFSGPDRPAVRIIYRIESDRLEIEVRNKGNAFQSSEQPARGSINEHLREGGLGLFLIGTLMDSVDISCEDGEVALRMSKSLKPSLDPSV